MSATKGTRKSTPRKSPSSKSKARKRKSNFEKGKVYIPRYKTIFFCVCVIVVCITLLLITSIKNDKTLSSEKKEKQKIEQIAKTESKKAESKKSVEKKTENTAKASTKSNSIIANSTTTKETKASKASEKTESKKADAKKSPEPVKEAKTVQSAKVEPPKPLESAKSKDNQIPQANGSHPQDSQLQEQKKQQLQQQQQIQKTEPQDKFNFPAAVNKAELVFVFDDGGQNLSHIDRFLKLPFPITVAVLPKIAHSKETAKKVRQSGNEVILHQPMQSVNPKVNPGPGAITPDMSEDQIISTLFQNITEIGPISGINNHEGSGITADAEKMAVVMKTVSEEGLYFLDSRTNVETKVPYVAQEMGYHYYERNIFLDNEKTRENALNELKKGLNIANKNGVVIMIGHVWSADFLPAFLEEAYPELVRKGYTFKTVSNSKARK